MRIAVQVSIDFAPKHLDDVSSPIMILKLLLL